MPTKPPRPLAELSARYNGFTLGVFLTSMRDSYTERRYLEFRRRVLDFLDEVKIKVPIARTQSAFVGEADATLTAVLTQAKGVSSMLYDSIGLGAMAVLYASNARLVTVERAKILRERWVPVLERHRIPASAYDEWLEVLPKGDGVVTAEDVLTPAALLLA